MEIRFSLRSNSCCFFEQPPFPGAAKRTGDAPSNAGPQALHHALQEVGPTHEVLEAWLRSSAVEFR